MRRALIPSSPAVGGRGVPTAAPDPPVAGVDPAGWPRSRQRTDRRREECTVALRSPRGELDRSAHRAVDTPPPLPAGAGGPRLLQSVDDAGAELLSVVFTADNQLKQLDAPC